MEKHVFLYSPDQAFACRDCPSRCCKNWTVDITAADVARFQSQDWIQNRLRETKTSFLRLGDDYFLLPVIEVDRQMHCVFLEPDGLCGIHRRYGHSFLASSCQTFPFDFIEAEDEKIIVVTSKVCPSIRENYGDPVYGMIAEKFSQAGSCAKKQSPYLVLGQKTNLNLKQYSAVFRQWEKLISTESSLPLALAFCQRFLQTLSERWMDRSEVDQVEFEKGLAEAEEGLASIREQTRAELATESGERHRVVDVMLAMACLPLTYPLRSRILFQGARKALFLSGTVRALLSLFTLKGTIDAIHLGRSIPLHPGLRTEKVLDEAQIDRLRSYILEVLARRKFAMQPRSLEEILLVLVMVPPTYAFYAKLSAAGRKKEKPDPEDFREAISALEMSILHQKGFMGSSRLFQSLLPLILANPKTLFRLLTAEVIIKG